MGYVFGCDFKQRIDTGLDRMFAKQVGAERVNSADARFFKLPDCFVEQRFRFLRDLSLTRLFNFFT